MKRKRSFRSNKGEGGFTITELIVVIFLMGIMLAIALPPYIQWRSSVSARSTASSIYNALKLAKSRTITNSLQCRVEFQAAPTRQYRVTQGNRAANSNVWGVNPQDIIQEWTAIGPETSVVTANTLANNIEFNTNGTANIDLSGGANFAAVSVFDKDGVLRFTVQVDAIGRIWIH